MMMIVIVILPVIVIFLGHLRDSLGYRDRTSNVVVFCVLYTMYDMLYTACYIPYTVYHILCNIYYLLYAACCVP